jgi:hypothetical protein
VKFLILIHSNAESRQIWERMTVAERAAGIASYASLHQELTASGELIVSEALADPSEGRRVQVRDGRAVAVDRPRSESKEHMAGFFLVQVDTPERAVELAGRIPEAAVGVVEVRPVLDVADLS